MISSADTVSVTECYWPPRRARLPRYRICPIAGPTAGRSCPPCPSRRGRRRHGSALARCRCDRRLRQGGGQIGRSLLLCVLLVDVDATSDQVHGLLHVAGSTMLAAVSNSNNMPVTVWLWLWLWMMCMWMCMCMRHCARAARNVAGKPDLFIGAASGAGAPDVEYELVCTQPVTPCWVTG